MANQHGDFIWYELMTTAPDAAQAFYSSILGWTWEASDQPGMDYRLFCAKGAQVGGMMGLSKDMTDGGARPMWAGYVGVDDVDASANSIKAAGGSVRMGPQDIPGIGRFAFVTDPQGAHFYIMTDTSGVESHSFAKYEPKLGHCAWNELATTDPEAAKTFYGRHFGWVKDGEMDMGPMGRYEFLMAGGSNAYGIGAVMPTMPEMPVSAWSFYFRVPDIDAAVAAIARNGGHLVQEPTEIPGGEFALVGTDPQGATFGLVGPKRQER
jgi:predicted enzyme related to lactoylglutathione lyase